MQDQPRNRPVPTTNGRFIWDLMRGNWKTFAGCVAAMALSVCFSFLSPALVGFVIDSVIGTKPLDLPAPLARWVEQLGGRAWLMEHIIALAALFLCIVACSALFNMLRQYLASTLSESLAYSMRRRLFEHIQHLPYSWHMQMQTGDIMQRCSSDVDMVRNFVAGQMAEFLRIVTMLLGAFALMFSINVPLAGAAFVGHPHHHGVFGHFLQHHQPPLPGGRRGGRDADRHGPGKPDGGAGRARLWPGELLHGPVPSPKCRAVPPLDQSGRPAGHLLELGRLHHGDARGRGGDLRRLAGGARQP